jgi:hypothetical protein
MINPINGLETANQSGRASRNGSESRRRICQLVLGIVEWPDASCGND